MLGRQRVDILGYARPDGRVGIRNHVAVIYTVQCAQLAAEKISRAVKGTQVLGWPGCFVNERSFQKLISLGQHPNVAAVLVVGLGCEHMDYHLVRDEIAKSGKPTELILVQEEGGTLKTAEKGARIAERLSQYASTVPRQEMSLSDLIVGAECGGSDATSGLAANPSVGAFADLLVGRGGTMIVEEPSELLGCEEALAERAISPEVGREVIETIRACQAEGHQVGQFSIGPGNVEGGLTTIEEKSAGALAKSGTSPLMGVLRAGELPPGKGLYLLSADRVAKKIPGVEKRATNVPMDQGGDPKGVVWLIASGAHIVLFTTGRGNPAGCAVSPVIKICGNPLTYRRMEDNMDINAGAIIEGEKTVAEVGRQIFDEVLAVANGKLTKAELLGHDEY